MTTITEFLLARITEDEAEAREALPRESDVYGARGWFDPARVLAECAAKRVLVEQFWQEDLHTAAEADEKCGDCQVMYTLAAVYKDHKDYQPEWAL